MKKPFFDKKLLMFHILVLLYPVFYFMQQNVAEFLPRTYGNTIFYLCVYALLISATYGIGVKFENNILKGLYLLLLAFGLWFVLICTLLMNEFVLAGAVVFTIIIFTYLIFYRHFIKQALAILSLMCLFSIGSYLYPIVCVSNAIVWSKYPNMPQKPNIYFVILESYQGNEALRELYGFDNSAFLSYLTQKGFTVYSDIYSTRAATRLSLLSIFDMVNHKDLYKQQHLLDGCFTGRVKCFVLDTLRKNGYRFKTVFATNYLIHGYFKHGDRNKCFMCDSLFRIFAQKHEKKYSTVTDFNNDIISAVNSLKKSDEPYMFITKVGGITENDYTYKGGVSHVPNGLRYTNKFEYIPALRAWYIDELKRENVELVRIIDAIEKKDPNALVIMFGDHGANFLDITKDMEALNANNIPIKNYVLDLFNVMVAIRWPKGVKGNYSWQFLPQLFPVVFDALGVPMNDVGISPVVYDHKNRAFVKK